jgi:hypothetical protein
MNATSSKLATRRSIRRPESSLARETPRRCGTHPSAGAAYAPSRARRPLGRYVDTDGRSRELVEVQAAGGSVLVVDRDALTLGARRLVAHLGADEPAGNARLVCEQYLADPTRGHCRPVVAADLEIAPEASEPDREAECASGLTDERGRRYSLEPVSGPRSIPDLRWVARERHNRSAPLSLRDVIARLQSYEPARVLTRAAVVRHRRALRVSVSVLKGELERVDSSPIVLNRGLREAVLNAVRTEGVSASEIAIRCGRIKRDARGNIAGETSWLARRVGLAPEGGGDLPTPWIHSDVLGLIARRGLGLSPCEVELG